MRDVSKRGARNTACPDVDTNHAHTEIWIGRFHSGRSCNRFLVAAKLCWLDIGTARLDSNGVMHAFLDRTPIGGFNGYVYFAPIGARPPLPEPDRPAQPSDEEED
jgi:hypothetical protein